MNTSSAAERMTPLFSASAKSSSLTMPPRATFINMAEDFICANSFADIRFCVREVRGQCTETMSEEDSNSLSGSDTYCSSLVMPEVE